MINAIFVGDVAKSQKAEFEVELWSVAISPHTKDVGMALNKEVTAKIDDHVEQLSHAGESQKQLSMKEVVEAGIDCEYILQAAEVR